MRNVMLILIPLFLLSCIAYTSWRLWLILPLSPLGKTLAVAVYLLCFACVFLHYGLGNKLPIGVATVTYEIGTSWMIFFLYALLIFLALGLGRLLHWVPESFLNHSVAGTCTVLGIIAILLLYGGLHYPHKHREVLEIKTEKPLQKPLTIVLASDLHIGYHNRKAELQRWVRLLNEENPDLVLFAGDILDGAIRPVREWRLDEEFRDLNAPVYAALGNHEYIAGLESSLAFYEDAGMCLLRDSSVVASGIRIVGRDDRSNASRRALSDLVPTDTLFTILLDHQPYHLEEAERCGIDFQFSGHTHHGQIWPANWITDILYEKAYGAYRRGNTHYYVTSGLGIWGGKFRIGSQSEYLVLKLKN